MPAGCAQYYLFMVIIDIYSPRQERTSCHEQDRTKRTETFYRRQIVVIIIVAIMTYNSHHSISMGRIGSVSRARAPAMGLQSIKHPKISFPTSLPQLMENVPVAALLRFSPLVPPRHVSLLNHTQPRGNRGGGGDGS